MAIAGDTHHIPSFPVSLAGGRIQVHGWSTNKPRKIVEQDLRRAALRLLDGERFNLHCSGPQVMNVKQLLQSPAWLIWLWRLDRWLERLEEKQGWRKYV